MKKVLSDKKNRIFFYGIIVYMILALFLYWERVLDIMNTTVFAFSYKYGFVSRGVLGSFLQFLDKYTSLDALTYNMVFRISEAATAIYFLMILIFVFSLVYKCKEEQLENVRWIALVVVFLSVPMFLSKDNFGRLDVYLMIITLFCLTLIVLEKCEFLIIPAVFFATLIHEGFVFMNLNIILVLLLYKLIVKKDKKKKIKYAVYLGLTFVLPSIVFLYCEFFSHTFDMNVYNEIYSLAAQITVDHNPHKQVLVHEILGQDIKGMEVEHHRWNLEDTPIFLVLFSPYIIYIIYFFRTYVKTKKEKIDSFISFIVIAAPLTLVPEILLKVDFGRYAFAIVFYYLAIVLVLLGLRDNRMQEVVIAQREKIINNKIISLLGLAYLFMFIPFRGYRICDIVTTLTRIIFKN